MGGASVRRAAESDVAAVRRLAEEWAAEEITYGFVPDGEEEIAARLRGPYFVVAELGGKLVGFAYGSARTSEGEAVAPAGVEYLEIENLYVAARHRGGGVGGLLVERLLGTARGRGLRGAQVYSATKDVRRVLKFYEGHGFSSWYVRLFRDI